MLKIILGIIILIVSLPSYAEVSDKMPTITDLWSKGVVIGLIAISCSFIRWWAPLMFIPVTLFFSIASIGTITDPNVGPAILNEQGNIYGVSAIGAAAMIIVCQAFSIWRGYKLKVNFKETPNNAN